MLNLFLYPHLIKELPESSGLHIAAISKLTDVATPLPCSLAVG
jgi:hypothetical protein